MTLTVVGLDQIRAVATPDVVFAAVREAFRAHADGRTTAPPPMHLAFPAVQGDCHVKAGYIVSQPYFTVKVASGFYRNAEHGQPTNNGLVLALDAATGQPAVVLADEGWLTAWRTAACGAIVTDALAPPGSTDVAVLGTGLQAQLQIEWLHRLRPLTTVRVWGRRHDKASELAATLRTRGIDARATNIEDATAAECVITATASTSALAPAEAFAATRHVTALGTDMPGKGELPSQLFSRAGLIATDDHDQCLDHGDFGNAVRAGAVAPDLDVAIATILDRPRPDRQLTIADLTGLGVADAAVANAVVAALVG